LLAARVEAIADLLAHHLPQGVGVLVVIEQPRDFLLPLVLITQLQLARVVQEQQAPELQGQILYSQLLHLLAVVAVGLLALQLLLVVLVAVVLDIT
jgi:hypothetical protein